MAKALRALERLRLLWVEFHRPGKPKCNKSIGTRRLSSTALVKYLHISAVRTRAIDLFYRTTLLHSFFGLIALTTSKIPRMGYKTRISSFKCAEVRASCFLPGIVLTRFPYHLNGMVNFISVFFPVSYIKLLPNAILFDTPTFACYSSIVVIKNPSLFDNCYLTFIR